MQQGQRIRVVNVSIGLGTGGLERIITILTERIDRTIFDVSALCLKFIGEFGEYLKGKGHNVEMFPQNPKRFDLRDPWKLSRYFKEKRVDVVHAHSGAFFMSVAAAKLAGIPAIFYTDHGRPQVEGTKRMIEEAVTARFVDRVIAVSAELKKHLIEKTHFPAGKIDVIINGIDTEIFRPATKPTRLIAEFGLRPNAKIIGSTGRLSWEKGYQILIESFPRILQRIPDCFLLLVGDGPMRGELETQAKATGCESNIIFAGVRSDIPDLLNLFDVFVLPSIYEGTSMALLEAMASGTTPVATAVGGNVSVVDDRVNGIIVPPNNPEALGNAICELILDEKRLEALGLRAIEKIKVQYSQTGMIKAYESLYLDTLHKKGLFKDINNMTQFQSVVIANRK